MTIFELEAILSLDTRGFETSVSAATSESSKLAKAIGADADSIKRSLSTAFSFSVGDLMADGIRAAGSAMWGAAKDSVMYASSLEEIENVINTVFGDDAPAVQRWADDARESFGMAKIDALDFIGQFGAVLKAQDFSPDQILEMSQAVVQLAGDYASFLNLDFEDAFSMLRSGLRGETESIERLGLSVHVGTMVDYLGLDKESDYTGKSQADQLLARYQYIMDKSSYVQGDFEKTSGSFANQLRTLKTNVKNFQTELGDDFLPVGTAFLQFLNFFFEDTKSADEAVSDIRETFAETFTSIESTTASALALVNALRELEEGGLQEGEQSEWERLVSSLLNTVPQLAEAFPTATDALNAGSDAIEQYILNLREMELEAGRAKVMSEYYEFLGEQQAIYAKEKSEYEEMAITNEGQKQLYTQTWTDALKHLNDYYGEEYFTAEEVATLIGSDSGRKTAMQSLNALANRGDTGAEAFYDVLASLRAPDDLDSQLALEKNEMDAALLNLQKAENQIDVLVSAIDALSKQSSAEGDQSLAAVKDALALKQQPPAVNVEVYMNADTTPLVTEVVRVVTREIKQKAM